MKVAFLIVLTFFLNAKESATGADIPYRKACLQAASDPVYFKHFRSIDDYAHVVEIKPDQAFANYLSEYAFSSTLQKLEYFRRLDRIGGPDVLDFSKLGIFSGTTLRYIAIGDQIEGLFSLPPNPKIAEIGAGFGGQCYVLSALIPFSSYWIYDLPETEQLIQKVLNELQVKNAFCLSLDEWIPEEKIDLLISNYAFSECDRSIQMDYFERVVKKADRGYFLYNRVCVNDKLDAITPEEFIELLKINQMHPILYPELICTYEGNVLIIWDRT